MYKKLTKSQVVARLNRLQDDETLSVTMCPSKCRPQAFAGIHFDKSDLTKKDYEHINTFERYVNNFYYYNCIPETGMRVHFYIKEAE